MKANLGIMITASHNPFHDNGLKLFGPDGMKLSDNIEKKIENLIDAKITSHLSEPKLLGRVKRLEDGNDRYVQILRKNFPNDFSLIGMRIVLDCANGAGYKSAPKILSDLGAKVFTIGIKPDGLNINHNCGSTFPEILRKHVKKFKADLGIALDGDADRVIMCDENAQIIDGDQIIAMIAKRWKRKKILKGGVIGTLMSNYGLEKFFLKEKINFKRSKVGDRYVKEMMKKNKFNLGGEQSGHIILGKFATTGDGLLVALEALFALRKRKLASKMFKVYQPVPQKLLNIKVKDKKIINTLKCKKAIRLANLLIKDKGRLLVRPSGTEPKVRIMCESFNISLMNKCIAIVKKTIH
jgi:phosphoglucosamine mutase